MNKKKLFAIMFIVILMVFIFTGSVAYYRYTLEGKIIASTGNAVFNVTGINNETKIIDLGNTLLPGDRGSFTITLDSTGSTVDMYATLKIDRKVLPDNLKFYSTSDYKSEIKTYYSFLEISGTRSETITIYWYWNPFKDDEDDNKYVGKSLSADISVSAVQISEYAMMKNGYSSASGANGGTEFWNYNYKPYIRMVNFINDLSNLPSSCTEENLCWDISYSSNQNKKVYAYLIDSGLKDSTDSTKTLYNLYIAGEAPIFAPANSSIMFYRFENLVTINFNNNFNTSKVTDMHDMFGKNLVLESLDLSSFNTKNVTSMLNMFSGCKKLTSLDLSSFNTSNLVNMFSMFSDCTSFENINLGSFNTSNVTNMQSLFFNCSSLKTIVLSSFNTSKVTNLSGLFMFCSSLETIDLSKFNTSKVTNMNAMFFNCISLKSLDLSNFDTSSLTSVFGYTAYSGGGATAGIFEGCKKLVSVDLTNFNTSKVTNMKNMFKNCLALKELNLSSFNTSNVTDMYAMFMSCESIGKLNISNFDTSKVTVMDSMFYNCPYLQTEISIMNGNISSYSNMFSGGSLSSANAYVVIKYVSSTSTIVQNMRATANANYQSKITLSAI